MSSSSSKPLSPGRDLLAGAAAGIISRLVVAPLDVLKIRFQVQSETRGLYQYTRLSGAVRSIVSKEGVSALWKGNTVAMLMVTPYASLQFSAFYQLQQTRMITREPWASLSLGALSAMFATVCTYPLDLLRTRFAAQAEPRHYHSLRHATSVIYARDGVRGFYAGLRPTLLQIVPYISLHFALYETGKAAVLDARDAERLSVRQALALGAVSGTTSKLITLPLDNAKKVLQVEQQFSGGERYYRGMTHVLQSLWIRDGIRGWFRGVAPSLLKAAPNSAISFSVYEAAKRVLSKG